ncbi:hypothetical protein [Flavisolibacter tropicus]|uniref:Uncharacterized protein n=1 Tax=Flavisolibacter tropicus TaxID=1492898 RepID=A0A172TST6_9BACT|nr:hypothetical protein [Flavisolibacter tropicus]ANE49847.1 hypothetical protein SY85_04415 [Flavisolibacter tropicus]
MVKGLKGLRRHLGISDFKISGFKIGVHLDSTDGVFEPQRKLSEPGFGEIKGLGGRNNEQGRKNEEVEEMFNAQLLMFKVQVKKGLALQG